MIRDFDLAICIRDRLHRNMHSSVESERVTSCSQSEQHGTDYGLDQTPVLRCWRYGCCMNRSDLATCAVLIG